MFANIRSDEPVSKPGADPRNAANAATLRAGAYARARENDAGAAANVDGRNDGQHRPSRPAGRRIPTFPEVSRSKQIELDGDLVPCSEAGLAPDLRLHRQQIAAAVERKYG